MAAVTNGTSFTNAELQRTGAGAVLLQASSPAVQAELNISVALNSTTGASEAAVALSSGLASENQGGSGGLLAGLLAAGISSYSVTRYPTTTFALQPPPPLLDGAPPMPPPAAGSPSPQAAGSSKCDSATLTLF